MSETTETKAVTSTKAKGEIGPSMLGSEILVKALERGRVWTPCSPTLAERAWSCTRR
ncbi:MAG: hypothetical protein Ct9H300mP32_1610 [Verrucomicrobiota bacterium]|nr:MAG: hypothetical protein Ct9H300mP32_1610 [Verrucomicrobiota bacterium]